MLKRSLLFCRNSLLLVVAFVSLHANASALPVAGGAAWGTPGNNGQDRKLGPTNEETCFLRGITGDLNGIPYISGEPDSFLPARAEVFMKNGYWWVRTRAGAGTGVMAHVICLKATANRVQFSWSNNLTTAGVKATPNRQCFLSGIWATTGMSVPSSHLTIKKVNGWFNISGHVENIAGDSDYGGATVTCVDISPTASWGFAFTDPSNASNSATTTVVLRDSYPNGNPVPMDKVGCFLTSIEGNWSVSPDPLGWDDGALLIGDPKVSSNWLMKVSNGRTGGVTCLR